MNQITVIANYNTNTIEISDGQFDIEINIVPKYMSEAEQAVREYTSNLRNLRYAPVRAYLETTLPLGFNYTPKKATSLVNRPVRKVRDFSEIKSSYMPAWYGKLKQQ